MAISEHVFSIYLDGRVIVRGLSRREAESHADYFARNVCRLKAADKRRAHELTVKEETVVVTGGDNLYKWAKQGG